MMYGVETTVQIRKTLIPPIITVFIQRPDVDGLHLQFRCHSDSISHQDTDIMQLTLHAMGVIYYYSKYV